MERKSEQRKKEFRSSFEESSRQREEQFVQIRKVVRNDTLAKRRQQIVAECEATQGIDTRSLVAQLQDGDIHAKVEACRRLRKALSVKEPPIDQVIGYGGIPLLLAFVQNGEFTKLQFEATWALTNILSGTTEQTSVVVQHNAIPVLVQQLSVCKDEGVIDQIIWALANVAGDSPPHRDAVLQAGVIPVIVSALQNSNNISSIRNASWMLSNLCRGKPKAPIEAITPVLPLLSALLDKHDTDVRVQACWGVCYYVDAAVSYKQRVIELGIVPKLIQCLRDPAGDIRATALRAVGNLLTGNDRQTQAVLDCGVLIPLAEMLHDAKKHTRKDACWALSNITAGTVAQIQLVLDSGLMPRLIELFGNSDFDVQKEIGWVMCNAIAAGTNEQREQLARSGCVLIVARLLDINEHKLLKQLLLAVEKLLEAGRDYESNPFSQLLEEVGVRAKLETLEFKVDNLLSQKVGDILRTYYSSRNDINEVDDAPLNPPIGIGPHSPPPGGYVFS